MSQENVELAREVFQHLHSEGVESVMPYLHPDFEFSTPPSISVEPQTYRGHAGMRLYFEQWADAADRVQIVPEEFFDAGDRGVVVSFRIVARGRETGIETELPAAMVWHVRERQAVGLDIYPTVDEAKKAAGLNA